MVDRIEDSNEMKALPSDFEDPHFGAVEDNPERAERPSWRLILAILVCQSIGPSLS